MARSSGWWIVWCPCTCWWMKDESKCKAWWVPGPVMVHWSGGSHVKDQGVFQGGKSQTGCQLSNQHEAHLQQLLNTCHMPPQQPKPFHEALQHASASMTVTVLNVMINWINPWVGSETQILHHLNTPVSFDVSSSLLMLSHTHITRIRADSRLHDDVDWNAVRRQALSDESTAGTFFMAVIGWRKKQPCCQGPHVKFCDFAI